MAEATEALRAGREALAAGDADAAAAALAVAEEAGLAEAFEALAAEQFRRSRSAIPSLSDLRGRRRVPFSFIRAWKQYATALRREGLTAPWPWCLTGERLIIDLPDDDLVRGLQAISAVAQSVALGFDLLSPEGYALEPLGLRALEALGREVAVVPIAPEEAWMTLATALQLASDDCDHATALVWTDARLCQIAVRWSSDVVLLLTISHEAIRRLMADYPAFDRWWPSVGSWKIGASPDRLEQEVLRVGLEVRTGCISD